MNSNTFEQSIFDGSNPDIVKRVSSAKLFLTLGMIALGILFFLIVFQQSDQSSTSSMALMVAGSILLLIGVFRLFWKSKDIFYVPTGSTAKSMSLFFNLKDLPLLRTLIDERHFDLQPAIQSATNGNVRLDVLLTSDHQFVALQLFQFVPYTYNPVTTVAYFKGDEAESVSSFLVGCKNK